MRRRLKTLSIGAAAKLEATSESHPIELEERKVAVELAMNSLQVNERDAIAAIARVGGRSCRQIACQYEVSLKTVYRWAKQAGDKLGPRLRHWQ